jgi:Dullard-like phosphatase family protein
MVLGPQRSSLEGALTRAPQGPQQPSGFVQRMRSSTSSKQTAAAARPPPSKELLPRITNLPRRSPATVALSSAGFERRLQEWRAKPKNISPATDLKLEPMLPPPLPAVRRRMLLVLDVDETLVHASFTPEKPFDVKITIELDGEKGDIFVAFRPHLFTFLEFIAPLFEVAIFTASQSCYAEQLMDHIDPDGRLGRLRLFREHCTEISGGRVKDLSLLGRSLDRIALVDNSPVTYLFQPRNAIPIKSWFEDPRDVELLKLMPMLQELAQATVVYDVLDRWHCER